MHRIVGIVELLQQSCNVRIAIVLKCERGLDLMEPTTHLAQFSICSNQRIASPTLDDFCVQYKWQLLKKEKELGVVKNAFKSCAICCNT